MKIAKQCKDSAVRAVRLIQAAMHYKLTSADLNLRAMSLAYLTLLSLVPLMVVCFVVLKAFAVHDKLQPALLEALAPLGEQGREISERMLDFVENIKIGVLGATGTLFLFYTIISLVRKVEKSFNAIWQINKHRSLARTFSDYLSVIVIGPVLLFAAVGLKATLLSNSVVQSMLNIEPFGTLLLVLGKTLPYLLLCASFAFIYGLIPNTKVRISAALLGGVFAGLLWYASGWVFTAFVVTSSNYSAIYSGFAGLVLFVLWIYLAWLITLLGAQVSYWWQHPPTGAALRSAKPGARPPRPAVIAFAIMTVITGAQRRRQPPPDRSRLRTRLAVPLTVLEPVLKQLLKAGLIAETKTSGLLLAPLPDSIPLNDVIAAVEGPSEIVQALPNLAKLLADVDTKTATVLDNKTLADLVEETTASAEAADNDAAAGANAASAML